MTARRSGHPTARRDGKYIRVELARPVPEGGQGRIRIDKTYKDPKSYWSEGDRITFSRSLGITRNAVVLPPGYEVVACNYPAQIVTEPDGRIKVSFMNRGPQAVQLVVEGQRLPGERSSRQPRCASLGSEFATTQTQTSSAAAQVDYAFAERAFQDRDIVYFLQQPETHCFRLYHDYTETRPGVDRYLNVVRGGSRVNSW